MPALSPSDKYQPPRIELDKTGIYCVYTLAGRLKVKQVEIIENRNDLEIIEYANSNGESEALTRVIGSTFGEDIIKNAKFVKVVRPRSHVVTFRTEKMQTSLDLANDKDNAITDMLKAAVKFGIIQDLPSFIK